MSLAIALNTPPCTSDDLPAGVAPRWVLARNCSLPPVAMALAFGGIAALSLLIGFAFYLVGAGFVLLFAGIEVLALGAAFACCARHATDRETLTLAQGRLNVERAVAGRVEHDGLPLHTVRVGVDGAGLVSLAGGGRCVSVGRHVNAQRRAALVGELRVAIDARASTRLP